MDHTEPPTLHQSSRPRIREQEGRETATKLILEQNADGGNTVLPQNPGKSCCGVLKSRILWICSLSRSPQEEHGVRQPRPASVGVVFLLSGCFKTSDDLPLVIKSAPKNKTNQINQTLASCV